VDRIRVRDPERAERILAAAVQLFVDRGYHAVNIGDIGGEAGIVGTGIYRHYKSKAAILVEVCERVVDRLVQDAEVTMRTVHDPAQVLVALIRRQVEFTIEDRKLYFAYVLESRNLPEADERRLRWKQRHYVELWIDMLCAIRPELDRSEANFLVGVGISAIHSLLRWGRSGLPDDRLASMLEQACYRAMGIADLVSADEDATADEAAQAG
jgi:AcrR family transcriptional regulator